MKSNDGDYILNGMEKLRIRHSEFGFHGIVVSFLGKKSFVIYSQHTNLLIVVAEKSNELKNERNEDENDFEDSDDEFFDAYLAFVIDPKSSGITVRQEPATIGCNDVPFATVEFCNVYVKKNQILSETVDDRKISEKLVASSRLQLATLNMIVAKNMFRKLMKFVITTDCNAENLR